MKTTTVKRAAFGLWFGESSSWKIATFLLAVCCFGFPAFSQVTVTTIGGGPTNFPAGLPYGFADGSTLQISQFNGPNGIALDPSGTILYVADTTNGAVRRLDSVGTPTSRTTTIISGLSSPVDVAVDAGTNLYVLTQGDGLIRKYDVYLNPPSVINATALSSPTAFALDLSTNFYVTELGGSLKRVSVVGGAVTTLTNLASALRGVDVMDDGRVAISDTGANAIRIYDPLNSQLTLLAGGLGVGTNDGPKTIAKFNSPYHIAKAGSGLVVADHGNHKVRLVAADGSVSTLYGVPPAQWFGINGSDLLGWFDGTLAVAESREPTGVVVDNTGNVYTTEDYYHIIRKVTGTGIVQLPAVAAPQIGVVRTVVDPVSGLTSFAFIAVTNSVFNNTEKIVILPAETGVQTLFTSGATPGLGQPEIPHPINGSTAPPYALGTAPPAASLVSVQPDLTIKAISAASGRKSSSVTQARFQFVTATPTIAGDNAASFQVSDVTTGAQMFYTIDGSDPTNGSPSLGPISAQTLSFTLNNSNLLFKIRAFQTGFLPSGIASNLFSPSNFVANRITFGFGNGEASSDFVAAAGQTFFAPVTLTTLPGQAMYSLQFNLTVSNTIGSPVVVPGAIGFESFLEKKLPSGGFAIIPPAMFAGYVTNQIVIGNVTNTFLTNVFDSLLFTNTAQNLLGVGWLERKQSFANIPAIDRLYDPIAQTLISFSQAHDTGFPNDAFPTRVILGSFNFQVPTNAGPGSTYSIRIGRPSATSDGISADVFIDTPTNGSLTASSPINSIRTVSVGSRPYIVGDVTPFRWFNAGDFGDTNLLNNDVLQAFQSIVYGLNRPPTNTDFYNAMDSSNGSTNLTLLASYGDDTVIDTVLQGDGLLQVDDIYVTYRRSLDPSRVWVARYWSNGVRQAVTVPNTFRGLPRTPSPGISPSAQAAGSTEGAAVTFSAGDAVAGAGQTLQIPITAKISGSLPLRVLMFGLQVLPLDGAPALTSAVTFTPSTALGAPTYSSSLSASTYGAAWLNSSIAGLTGTSQIGVLTIKLPAGASPNAAYCVHFSHVSGSPNGLGLFPQSIVDGIVTLRDRSGSTFGDTIPDTWRLRYFGSASNILSQALADADGDGIPNWAEYKAGTNPNDASSALKLLPASPAPGGGLTIQWPTVTDKVYVIEVSDSLFGGTWIPVSTNTGTGLNAKFQDIGAAGARFYRVRLKE